MDKVTARLKETAAEMKWILNTALNFMEKSDRDKHDRKFKILMYEGAPVSNMGLPKKYALGVIYEIDGTPYTIIKPNIKARTDDELDHYIECLLGFAHDVANGYASSKIEAFDKDFAQLVDAKRIEKVKDQATLNAMSRRSK